jgi:hypothetical protein
MNASTDTTSHLEEPEADRRYRVMVVLARGDRPETLKFHCPRCTMPVAELVNTQVIALSDAMEMDNGNLAGVGVRCDGRYQGRRCNVWYYMNLNDTAGQANVAS